MMFTAQIETTKDRGATPEEIAERCLNKIVHISENAPQPIRDQAHAYKEELRQILVFYMKEAVQSDRTTVYSKLRLRGFDTTADILKKL